MKRNNIKVYVDIENCRSAGYKLAYDAFASGRPLRAVKIGDVYRIPIRNFSQWLFGEIAVDDTKDNMVNCE